MTTDRTERKSTTIILLKSEKDSRGNNLYKVHTEDGVYTFLSDIDAKEYAYKVLCSNGRAQTTTNVFIPPKSSDYYSITHHIDRINKRGRTKYGIKKKVMILRAIESGIDKANNIREYLGSNGLDMTHSTLTGMIHEMKKKGYLNVVSVNQDTRENTYGIVPVVTMSASPDRSRKV